MACRKQLKPSTGLWIPGSSPGMTECEVGVPAKCTGGAARAAPLLPKVDGAGEACAPGTTSPPSSQGLTLGSIRLALREERWQLKPRAWLWIPGSSPGMTECEVGVLTTRTAGADARFCIAPAELTCPALSLLRQKPHPTPARLTRPGTTSPPSSQGLTLGSTAEHGGQAGATASPCARHDWHHRSGKASIAWRHRPAPRRFRAGEVAYSGTAALA